MGSFPVILLLYGDLGDREKLLDDIRQREQQTREILESISDVTY
jgi:hypothetical protein